MKKFLAILLVAAMAFSLTACKSSDYKKAVGLFDAGDYEGAVAAFTELGDYKDGADYIQKANEKLIEIANENAYADAAAKLDAGEFKAAIDAFTALGDFKDSAVRAQEAYNLGVESVIAGEWTSAPVNTAKVIAAALELDEETTAAIDIGEIPVVITMRLNEDGSANFLFVEEKNEAFFRGMIDLIKSVTVNSIKAELESTGIPVEQILNQLGVTDVVAYIEEQLGMSIDDLAAEALEELSGPIVEGFATEGSYTVNDGAVAIKDGSTELSAKYDFASETLTVSGEGISDELAAALYPMTFTKN